MLYLSDWKTCGREPAILFEHKLVTMSQKIEHLYQIMIDVSSEAPYGEIFLCHFHLHEIKLNNIIVTKSIKQISVRLYFFNRPMSMVLYSFATKSLKSDKLSRNSFSTISHCGVRTFVSSSRMRFAISSAILNKIYLSLKDSLLFLFVYKWKFLYNIVPAIIKYIPSVIVHQVIKVKKIVYL